MLISLREMISRWSRNESYDDFLPFNVSARLEKARPFTLRKVFCFPPTAELQEILWKEITSANIALARQQGCDVLLNDCVLSQAIQVWSLQDSPVITVVFVQ